MTQEWRLVPFRAAHVQSLELRPGARALLERLDALDVLAARYEAAGPAWTLFSQGRAVACGGAVRFWPGVGECWCWLSEAARQCPVVVARRVRAAVAELRDLHGFTRLQAHVRAEDEQAGRFASFVGLIYEGACPGFGPDQATHHLYGRFWQWKA
jgi:hypothetical protein